MKPSTTYLLWNPADSLNDYTACEVDPKLASTEQLAADLMHDNDNDFIILYKLVPIRKYERTSGVKATELKGE